LPTFEEEKQKNLKAYQELREEIRSKYQGMYVAIAQGKLVKVAPSFEEADEAVKNHRHRLVFMGEDEPTLGPLRLRARGVRKLIG
jgi:hypothetical protein